MLVEDAEQTIGVASDSLRCAHEASGPEGKEEKKDFYLETLGISEEEKEELRGLIARGSAGEVDPVVSYLVAATNGIAYKSVVGTLDSYPIPELRLPESEGEIFLDVGCNWGRWSVAAAEEGYEVIGIDPSLEAIRTARRVGRQYGHETRYVVADGRYLPFRSSTFDTVFSYSVLQHFAKEDARSCLLEVDRVLQTGGQSLIQMANAWGIRSLYHQMRRGFRTAQNFEVRYWTVPELRNTFESVIGASTIEVDCFFGLGLQKSDIKMMSPLARKATQTSEILRAIAAYIPAISYVADSVYVHSCQSSK